MSRADPRRRARCRTAAAPATRIPRPSTRPLGERVTGESLGLGRGVGVERGLLRVLIARPEAEADRLVRVGLLRHAVGAGTRRRAAPGEACQREVEAVPEEVDRTRLAAVPARELLQDPVDPGAAPSSSARRTRRRRSGARCPRRTASSPGRRRATALIATSMPRPPSSAEEALVERRDREPVGECERLGLPAARARDEPVVDEVERDVEVAAAARAGGGSSARGRRRRAARSTSGSAVASRRAAPCPPSAPTGAACPASRARPRTADRAAGGSARRPRRHPTSFPRPVPLQHDRERLRAILQQRQVGGGRLLEPQPMGDQRRERRAPRRSRGRRTARRCAPSSRASAGVSTGGCELTCAPMIVWLGALTRSWKSNGAGSPRGLERTTKRPCRRRRTSNCPGIRRAYPVASKTTSAMRLASPRPRCRAPRAARDGRRSRPAGSSPRRASIGIDADHGPCAAQAAVADGELAEQAETEDDDRLAPAGPAAADAVHHGRRERRERHELERDVGAVQRVDRVLRRRSPSGRGACRRPRARRPGRSRRPRPARRPPPRRCSPRRTGTARTGPRPIPAGTRRTGSSARCPG